MYTSAKPYFYGTGRRKSSVARVRLYPGGYAQAHYNAFNDVNKNIYYRYTEEFYYAV